MERGPKIEHWRGCALGVVFVAFLGGHAHAHAQVATTVKDCEQLQRALGNERVKRIHVRGRIFLGDCVWQEGEMPRRDIMITGPRSASLECTSEETSQWKLAVGMRVYISGITLIDSSVVAPVKLLESCFLRDTQIAQFSLSQVVLLFSRRHTSTSPQYFLDVANQQDSARFCTLKHRDVFIEEMKLQPPDAFTVHLKQTFMQYGNHPLTYQSIDTCPRGSRYSAVSFLVISFFATVTIASWLGLIAWAMFRKYRRPEKRLERKSSNADESGTTEYGHQDHQALPFGELSLGPVIGKGCFSSVYRGTYKGATVAVKVFEHDDRSLMDSSEPLEAYLSCSTNHPNIVKSIAHKTQKWDDALDALKCIEADPSCSPFSSSGSDAFDFVEECTKPLGENWFRTWLVMEHCERGSLFSAIRAGAFLDDVSGDWKIHSIILTALDVASALEHLHSKGIIHGDLKSQNILLSTQNNDPRGFDCKVGDFGFSRVALNMTHIDTYTCGSVRAMPPEVLKDGVLTLAADVYSFGILLWELLAGTMPYRGWSHQMILHNVVEGKRPAMAHTWPNALTRLIEDCLQHKHLNRPNFAMITRCLSAMKLSPMLLPYGAVRRSFEAKEPGFDDKIHCFNLRLRISHLDHIPNKGGLRSPLPCHLEELPSPLASSSNSMDASENV